VLLEADPDRFQELHQRYVENPSVTCLNEMVAFEGEKSIDSLLKHHTSIPQDFDLLSIDIDGNDYHIWDGIKEFVPLVVVIEFNPSIGNNIVFIQVSR